MWSLSLECQILMSNRSGALSFASLRPPTLVGHSFSGIYPLTTYSFQLLPFVFSVCVLALRFVCSLLVGLLCKSFLPLLPPAKQLAADCRSNEHNDDDNNQFATTNQPRTQERITEKDTNMMLDDPLTNSTSTNGTPAAATSCEACGWAAACLSMLAFGSFGVPIKSKAALSVDIDPLVMQSYKTFMCFITSWLVLLAGEVQFHFTPWGIVSGLFWVPGGVATIYAIKAAGLAIGIGIGSSFIVLVSFVWGIFVFDEQIHSRPAACIAILLMMLGLMGMSYYSSPVVIDHNIHPTTVDATADGITRITSSPAGSSVVYQEVVGGSSDDEDIDQLVDTSLAAAATGTPATLASLQNTKMTLTDRTTRTVYTDSVVDSIASGVPVGEDAHHDEHDEDSTSLHPHDNLNISGSAHSIADNTATSSIQSSHQILCAGVVITKRRLGMLAAMFCGVWGGSIMAPMKYAPDDAKGVEFLISFAIGASIVTVALWVLRFLYYCQKHGSAAAAYRQLPSFHFRIMWLPGGTCGLLWSIGNFFSLFSVYYLGEGVGYPLVQTSILVSGLWGIFYFKEVQGRTLIAKWLLSSMATIAGIILLSYEHHEK